MFWRTVESNGVACEADDANALSAELMSAERIFEGTVEFEDGLGSVKTAFVGVAAGVVSFSRILLEPVTN